MAYTPFVLESPVGDSNRRDFRLLVAVSLLLGVGIAVLLSASYFKALQLYGDAFQFVYRQALWIVVGAAALATAALVSLEIIRKALPVLLAVTLVLSFLTLVPGVGARYLGARRWIFLFNVSFQPSELVKLTIVLYLAHIFSRREGDFARPLDSLLPPLLVVGLFSAIILFQNDFSTAVFVAAIALIMFFVSGVPISYFIRALFLVVPAGLIVLFSREHRVRRIIAFIDPMYDPAGSGYQVLAARSALSRGGFWGVGIGRGTRKLGNLPEAHSDFLFAVIGEEMGLAGVVFILALFAFFAFVSYRIAFRQNDGFRSLLVFGLATSIVLQALLNVAVVAGVVPATGIPLPFFSSGGSSLLISMTMCGLILNASRGEAKGEAWPRQ